MRLSFLSLSPSTIFLLFSLLFIYLQGYLHNKLKTLMLLELLVTFTNIYGQMTHSSSIMGLQSPIFEQKFGKKKLRNIFFPVALLYPLFGRSILCIPERKIHSCLVCVCVSRDYLLSKMLFMVKIMLCTKC